ncbi:hypothetical protein ABZV75_11740 [Streptomyces flaveolus]|uniref:hypothetical protein n=1 Tax=Streptomyces flaveolus TaxID=67297 RepID=UPI0033B5790A
MVELPVLDLVGHLLRGEVSLVAVAMDDELVQPVAVVPVADAFGGQPGEGGSAGRWRRRASAGAAG